MSPCYWKLVTPKTHSLRNLYQQHHAMCDTEEGFSVAAAKEERDKL